MFEAKGWALEFFNMKAPYTELGMNEGKDS